jgi:hypothetical protein
MKKSALKKGIWDGTISGFILRRRGKFFQGQVTY